MNDQFNEARELANLLLEPDSRISPTLVQGVVQSINVDGHISLYLSGMVFPVSKVKHLDSYDPRVGDTVWVLKNGPDLLIIGRVAEANPSERVTVLPWNIGWGEQRHKQDDTGGAWGALAPTVIETLDVPLVAGRRVRVNYSSVYRVSVADSIADWVIQWRISGGTYVGIRTLRSRPAAASAGTSTDTFAAWSRPLDIATDGLYDFRVVTSRISGTGTFTLTTQQILNVDDVGPTVKI